MSERGSFVTEYFYDEEDYKTIRKALNKESKLLCLSPPPVWSNSCGYTFEMPIVSGKVGSTRLDGEVEVICSALKGVITNYFVDIVVMCDSGTIVNILKHPNGNIVYHVLYSCEEF